MLSLSTRRIVALAAQQFSTSAPRAAASMFCQQCEQTQRPVTGGLGLAGSGAGKEAACTTIGVCGKTPEVAWMQDLLIEQVKNLATYTDRARGVGANIPPTMNKWVLEAMFSTLTNVNFDPERFKAMLAESVELERTARSLYEKTALAAGKKPLPALPAKVNLNEDLVEQGHAYGVLARRDTIGNIDQASVVELCTYGLKGVSAYAEHASQLGFEDNEVHASIQRALSKLTLEEAPKQSLEQLLGLALEIGSTNTKVMAMLDNAHTSNFGAQTPTSVRSTGIKGKAIVVSGHDMMDLKVLLDMTKGTGINVYTHGEMLPAHAYPKLKAYKHLVGNFGGAWQLQKLDFAAFPGPILMTTNCIMEPRKSYKDRIWTTNAVGFDGVKHVTDRRFEPIIERALSMTGFTADEKPGPMINTGFGHAAVLGLADTVIKLVKDGSISRFLFVGGCDGSEAERSYFTKLVKLSDPKTMILTAGCAKYRFNKLDLGTIAGLPRVLDVGQCNNSYDAVVIALALAKAFGTDVNGLPLSFAVSWLEQKAAAVLLSLLSLNVKGIRLGPTLPAFLSPNVLDVLVKKWDVKPIGDPAADLAMMMKGK